MGDRVGQQLDDYRLIRLLGAGTFGEVYLGEHIYHQRQVAVKVLKIHLAPDTLKEFLNEARTFRLKHPHIVQLLDFGIADDTPFLVMDYAPGGTLRQRHPQGTILPLESIVLYVKQVAAALQYAHEMRLIHRDVKPQNMLLGRNEEVLLSDFGIAVIAHGEHSLSTQEMAGTVPYMAPEQIRGKPRPASDQYALAVVVYEWLSGVHPFRGSQWEIISGHLSTPPPPLREKVPTIPSAIEEVVLQALAKDPKLRFVSVQAFATALEQASQTAGQLHAASPWSRLSSPMPLVTPSHPSSVHSHPVAEPNQSLVPAPPTMAPRQAPLSSMTVPLSRQPPITSSSQTFPPSSTTRPSNRSVLHELSLLSLQAKFVNDRRRLSRSKTVMLIGLIFLVVLGSAGFLYPWATKWITVVTTHSTSPTRTHSTPRPTSRPTSSTTVLAQDTFQRADHAFWGVASDGQKWGADANSLPSFVTMNHSGRIINGQGAYNATLGPPSTNADVVFSGSLSSFYLANLGSVLRWQDKNDWYKAYLDGLQLVLIKNVNGTMTRLKTGAFTAQANTFYSLRFRVIGSQLMARAWPTGQAEPQNWLVMATDNTFTNGFGGLRLFVVKGVNVTITSFTETSVANP